MSFSNAHASEEFKMQSQTDLDDDDEIMRKMEEETNLAIMNISGVVEASKPPVQLAVDVEVEACSETEDYESTCAKESAHVSPMPAKRKRKRDAYEMKPLSECSGVINKVMLFKELDNIIKHSNEPTDVELAIHTRNIWGKVFRTPHKMSDLDVNIQGVINSLFNKESIVTYKCYICIQAWWFLSPFREHIQKHRNVTVRLEKGKRGSNIIAYDNTWAWMAQVIHAHGNCYRCNRDFGAHLDSKGNYMKCFFGEERITFDVKKERCKICKYVGKSPQEHYTTCHTVRSDVPIETGVRVCKVCNDPYYMFTIHECLKRKNTSTCYRCHGYFATVACLDIHMRSKKRQCHCTECGLVMMEECMMPYHLLEHTKNFVMVELCTVCKGNLVFYSSDAVSDHMTRCHRLPYVKRRPFLTIIPRSCRELSESGATTSNKQVDVDLTEDDPEVDDELFSVKDELFNDTHGGYELLLSKVFNFPSSSASDKKEETPIKKENTESIEETEDKDDTEDVPNAKLDSDDSSEEFQYMEILFKKKYKPATKKNAKIVNKENDRVDPEQSNEKDSNIIEKENKAPEESTKRDSTVINEENNKTDMKESPELDSEVMNKENNETESTSDTKLDSKDKDSVDSTEVAKLDSKVEEKEMDTIASEESPKPETSKEIHKVFEKVADEFEKDVCESDDDVQIIDVADEIYEIDDDDNDDMQTDSVDSKGNDGAGEASGTTAGDVVDVKIKEAKESEQKAVKTGTMTEIEIVKVETENEEQTTDGGKKIEIDIPNKPATVEENHIKRIIRYFDLKGKDDTDNIEYVSDNCAIFQISQDSDSDDQLHIAFSDDENSAADASHDDGRHDDLAFAVVKREEVEIDGAPKVKVPKIYDCRCGFSGVHREYKEHLKQCTVQRRSYNKTKLLNKFKIKHKYQPLINCIQEYKCTKCSTNFATMKDYVTHLENHGYEKDACPVCSLETRCPNTLADHVMSLHVNRSYYKSWCIVKGNTDDPILGYNCKTCRKPVVREDTFRHWEQHLKLNHTEERVKKESLMEIIENTTMDKSLLRQIIEIMAPNYLLLREQWQRGCIACAHVVTRRSDYKRHLVEHLLKDAQWNRPLYGMLRCQICAQDLRTDRAFRDHVRDHACLAVYKCQPCNIVFSNSSNFSKHKKLHSKNLMTCDICNKKFHKRQALERHMIMEHIKKLRRVCRHCGAEFSDRELYKAHLKHEHNGYGPKCSICELRWRNNKELADHQWTEHRTRKLCTDCFLCGQEFRKFSNVKMHMRKEHDMVVTRDMF